MMSTVSDVVSEESYLRTCFDDMDLNKDGFITEEDMRTGIEQNIFDPVLASMFIGHFDKNGDRRVSYEEYREKILLIPFQAMDEKRLRIFFKMVDRDDSGKLSINELKLLYAASGCEVAEKDLNAFIESFDKNSDGEISEDEFIEQLKRARGY